MLNVDFEAMREKLQEILETARYTTNPLEDLEREILNLHSVSDILTIEEVNEYTAWRDVVPFQYIGKTEYYYDKCIIILECDILNYWITNYR